MTELPRLHAAAAAEHCPQPQWIWTAGQGICWSNAAASREEASGLSERLAARMEAGREGTEASSRVLGIADGWRIEAVAIPGGDDALPAGGWLINAMPLDTSAEPEDPVTGAIPRGGLDREMDRWLSADGPSCFAVVFVDIDEFKSVNERHGHPAADGVLAEVVRRLQASVRENDIVARYGGDELVLLLASCRPGRDWEAIARRLREVLGRPHELPTGEERVGCSLGVAVYVRREPATAAELLHEADRRMYAVKRAGAVV